MSHNISRRHVLGLAGAVAGLAAISPTALASPIPSHLEVPARRLGVYHWDRQPGQISDFAQWINGRVLLAEDFLLRDSWAALEGANRLSSWQGTSWARRMVWAAYPFPDGQGSLAEAAAGTYNQHYAQLATNLVQAGMSNAILRFGHEFNGNWYPWSPVKDPGGVAAGELHFAEAFRQFVTTVRAVPGGHFTFVWNPVPGQAGVDLANCYPGDDYVDDIGIDIYDQNWNVYTPGVPRTRQLREKSWQNQLTDPNWGINLIQQFAAQHGKRLAVPEWGIWTDKAGHGGDDNAYFVRQMYDWMNTNDVAWNIYFNVYASDGNHDLYDTYLFPDASAEFQRLWNPSGKLPRPRPACLGTLYPSGTAAPTVFPRGTAQVQAHTGTFTQPTGTRARPYGNPWSHDRMVASLIRSGASAPPLVSYADVPAATALMIRYECPVEGDLYFSVYVNGTLAAAHVKLPAADRTRPTEYAMVTVPADIPGGATVTFQIDTADDRTVTEGIWDYVNLDTIGFAKFRG
jgi:Glycosyl hydrolase family 26